jgi:carotenoid 1,2-hydratase
MPSHHAFDAGAMWDSDWRGTGITSDHDAKRLRPYVSGNRRRALRPGNPWDDGFIHASGIPVEDQGIVSGGRQRSSGGGRADGRGIGEIGSAKSAGGFGFDAPVVPGGYTWWYVDALSDDGAYGLSVIGFIGSVFSPYYTLARHRSARSGMTVNPANHCAINVALYGRGKSRWAMTERGRSALHASEDTFEVGPSAMVWDGHALAITLDEVSVPFPRRIRGTLRLYPTAIMRSEYTLNPVGQHLWRPIAPVSRVEVHLTEPALRWSGHAYLDHNRGSTPIVEGFRNWTWTRAPLSNGAAVFYDGIRRNGEAFNLGLRFDDQGGVTDISPPPFTTLARSKWLIDRAARSEIGYSPRIISTMEDTPFYARSVIASRIAGENVEAVHESLSVDRFNRTIVQLMLPFRMPRKG